MRFNDINWEGGAPYAKKCFEEGGGSKAGTWRYLIDTQPQLHQHLPKTDYIPPGEDVDRFVESLKLDGTSKIVRACHKGDVTGMVDVLRTEVVIDGTRENIRGAIKRVISHAQSSEVGDFVQYETGEQFDGMVGVLVQDFCGWERGSIITHPHREDIYIIGYSMVINSYFSNEFVDEFVHNGEGQTINEFDGNLSPELGMGLETASCIIGLHRKLYDCGLYPPGYSFQTEFGIVGNNIMIYQGRLFKPFEAADFYVKDLAIEDFKAAPVDLKIFGITPEVGIEMPIVPLRWDFVDDFAGESYVAYLLNLPGVHHSTPLDLQPKNLTAYFPYYDKLLQHGHFRWMQRAQVTFGGFTGCLIDESFDTSTEHISRAIDISRIRIFSDGENGGYVVL
jgi:hypothetical protein